MLLLLLLVVQLAHSQSRTHKVVCPAASAREACELFNEAVEDDDEEIYRASNRDHLIVCFRPDSNLFLLLSYDEPHDNLWRDRKGGAFNRLETSICHLSSTEIQVSAVSLSLPLVGGFRPPLMVIARFASKERRYHPRALHPARMWTMRRAALQSMRLTFFCPSGISKSVINV
jgi:hypothetical protein